MSQRPFRQEREILVQIIKPNGNFFAEAICFYFNKSLENGKFRKCVKFANITTVFKKGARTSKNNNRPVSILPNFSKIFESLLSRQLLEFFDNISKFQGSFRKGYGTLLNIAYYWCLKFGKKPLTIIKLSLHY